MPAAHETAISEPLRCEAIDRDALVRAWDTLRDVGIDEATPKSLIKFAANAEERICKLAEELEQGRYVPRSLTEVAIPKSGGGHRMLRIPCVRDRVVERAVLDRLVPVIEPWLSDAAHAFRAGRGVASAVRRVVELREEGFAWVARTDIDDCFPSIPVGNALRYIRSLADDEQLADLIAAFLRRPARTVDGRLAQARGLAQGAPLSPMLANLVLSQIDRAILDEGFPLVRYADDMVIAADEAAECREALAIAAVALRRLGMRLGADKTEVMSFAEGFAFLGEDFGPRYPPQCSGQENPTRRVLYIARQGAAARVRDGRVVVVSKDDEELINVPTGHVDRVVVFGSVGVSAGLRTWAATNEIGVVFLTRKGHFVGALSGAGDVARTARLRQQFAAVDDASRTLVLARRVVEAKLLKQRVLLTRFGRHTRAEQVKSATEAIERLVLMLPEADSRDVIMGIEGAAAREYFGCLGELVPENVGFAGRTRRPPLDLANAALSYGYAVLLGECDAALRSVGLEPSLGVLHTEQPRRPSLALDLMEEFRPYVVDQVVVQLLRRGSLSPADARAADAGPGVLLTKAGRRVLLDAYERRMLQPVTGSLPGFAGSIRRHVYRQAQSMALWFENPDKPWRGLTWR